MKEALLNMHCLPVVQEHFRPVYRIIEGMLSNTIPACDAVIHIAGMR